MDTLTVSPPLSKLQLKLLKLYKAEVSDEDLKNIEQLLSNYFAQKAIREANKVWKEKSYSNDIMDEWLSKDLRK